MKIVEEYTTSGGLREEFTIRLPRALSSVETFGMATQRTCKTRAIKKRKGRCASPPVRAGEEDVLPLQTFSRIRYFSRVKCLRQKLVKVGRDSWVSSRCGYHPHETSGRKKINFFTLRTYGVTLTLMDAVSYGIGES